MINLAVKMVAERIQAVSPITDVRNIANLDTVKGLGDVALLEVVGEDNFKKEKDAYAITLRAYVLTDDNVAVLELKRELDKALWDYSETGVGCEILYVLKERSFGGGSVDLESGKVMSYNLYTVIAREV